jgi:glycerol-3-phosphate acyltransferase PlsY
MEWILPVLAYLFGSISSAIVVAKAFGLPDPRTTGSGNPGATNILRSGGKTAAAVTLLGDVLKGVIPVLLARSVTDDAFILALVAAMAYLGHLYPLFFGFRGGKGVATALGVYLALNPWMGLALIVTWLVAALVSRYSSLAALVAAALSPLFAWQLLPGASYMLMSVVLAALLFWRHRSNIQRLAAGREDKIKFGANT